MSEMPTNALEPRETKLIRRLYIQPKLEYLGQCGDLTQNGGNLGPDGAFAESTS